MKRDSTPAALPPNDAQPDGLTELIRLALGDGLGGLFPFSAGAGLEALLNRVEAGR